MFERVSIIGDGAMGTVLAMLLCGKQAKGQVQWVRMWGHDREQLLNIERAGENFKFLPGYKLPVQLEFEPDDAKIFDGADLVLSAVPCQFMRSVWERLGGFADTNVPMVSVAKGIEVGTLLRPDELVGQILGPVKFAVLSGPTIADELARELPATACAACEDGELARDIQQTFSTQWFRVYTNRDVVGVELAGAMKNVIAIAAGIIDGVGAGDNAKAALLSRGLTEITRLGMACGACSETFSGLAGLGDLVTTCISPRGRNRSFGERIGKGVPIEQARLATHSVIEGIDTCRSVKALAERGGVEMPITEAVYEVLFENKSIAEAITALMTRELKAE